MGLFTGVYETALATRDMNGAGRVLSAALQNDLDPVETESSGKIQISHTGIWIADHRLAIMTDSTGRGHVHRFLEKRGEGLL